jgi:hypothetical protein
MANMAKLGRFSIRRLSADGWDYLVEIEQLGGATLAFSAGVEDLDRMSEALDEQLDAMVAAAEQLGDASR